jgi:hypothetical protein
MPLVTRVSIGGFVRADVQVGDLCATGLSDVVRSHVTARCRAVHAFSRRSSAGPCARARFRAMLSAWRSPRVLSLSAASSRSDHDGNGTQPCGGAQQTCVHHMTSERCPRSQQSRGPNPGERMSAIRLVFFFA